MPMRCPPLLRPKPPPSPPRPLQPAVPQRIPHTPRPLLFLLAYPSTSRECISRLSPSFQESHLALDAPLSKPQRPPSSLPPPLQLRPSSLRRPGLPGLVPPPLLRPSSSSSP